MQMGRRQIFLNKKLAKLFQVPPRAADNNYPIWDHKLVVWWKDMLITKHIVSMKLLRLTPVLRPLFPYEFEIPAGPSMYPGSGGTVSPWRDCRASLAVLLHLSIIRLLQYDWLSGYWTVMCDGNMVSEYIFNFLWPLMNECIQNMFVSFATIWSVSMPNFTSI